MPTHRHRTGSRTALRTRLVTAVALLPVLALTACGDPEADATAEATPAASASGAAINTSPDQDRVRAEEDPEIAAAVPAEIRERGELVVAANGQGSPPLAFRADDDTTLIGVETDIAQLVADVLGLELRLEPTSWENIFLGVESGQYDVGFSNITVTEERKETYDFASYRVDELAFEARADSEITSIDEPADIAGLTVSVGQGTNQEQILLRWDEQNRAAGLEPADIQYYQSSTDYYLALQSGRIDLYLGPNPQIAYHVAVAGETKIVGNLSGGGEIEAEIAAMTAKDNGLVQPLSDALNAVIEDGTYAEVLARWNLESEAIPASEVNPPGLPKE
ncbi:ABC transporter substrate-binding protein [Allostreptomyces psammosilenae]|uniref:Polar amino acid transport system substrate-binding protein n=1 Tax=Allostreptomyces psammosilenae TaxID=1892865 RepID=A0A852ZR40_9ACTN|nr:ABC transporter substrate-binding protein [Allostreptomyces psammosilenae]NYI03750.1 polar amino acid transport system substrate-binding protein [Allostreptomyces psammosilenae]